ncbi:calcium-binding protein [Leptolyngbya sp. FACHB-671]|uniref:calcium-binding protein n=1 Tax=Leptolyngbya sp. FACHB-671 TaxID=2692812 RepID=UPI0016876BA2|nr:calcium-binding protein [Leptolyngbya sp. FACHB-671]MBD2072170.1 calcium-binding protein [Leptolyngbya sp. FACHB-671]
MSTVERDNEREHRIEMEIVVDAYSSEEQAMGWYCYLEDALGFPFEAKWLTGGHQSPSQSEKVSVVGMASEEECSTEMYVEVLYQDGESEDTFTARLYDIEPLAANEQTQEAIADWHYWVNRGYSFDDLYSDEEY